MPYATAVMQIKGIEESHTQHSVQFFQECWSVLLTLVLNKLR